MIVIYETTNTKNGKTYVGQHHCGNKYADDAYLGSGILIRKAIKLYGRKCFERKILYKVVSQQLADFLEISTIKKRKAVGKAEYNLASGGFGHGRGDPAWNKGKTFSKETKRKMSESAKKRDHSTRSGGGIDYSKHPGLIEKRRAKTQEQWDNGSRKVSTAFLDKARTNAIGRKWYTDGKVDKMLFECPEGWKPGRSIMKSRSSDKKEK